MTDYNIRFNLYDNITKGFAKIRGNVSKTGEALAKTQSYLDRLGQSTFIFNQLSQAASNFNNQIQQLSAPGVEFNSQMADLSAITGIAGADLNQLSEASRKVGISSGLGASQAAEAFKLLASNIDITTIGGIEGLKKLQKETITLSKASGVDLPTAANTMAAAINQFGMGADQAARVINTLGAGAKYGAAEIPDLADSLKATGTTAAQSGVSLESTIGALEVLSQSAIKGGEAGTGLRNIMLKMRKELGVDFNKVPLSEALTQLQPRLKDVEFLTKTFGLENVNAAQVLIANADAVGQMTDKVTGTNVAYEQAAIRQETYAEKLARVNAWIDNIKIGITNATGSFLPFVQIGSQALSTISDMAPALYLAKDGISWVAKVMKSKNVVDAIQNGLLATQNWLTAKATAMQWLFNAAIWASPITWVVAGIMAAVAAFAILWNKVEGFRAAMYGLWEAIKKVGEGIWAFLVERIKGLFTGLGKIGQAIYLLFTGKFKQAWNIGKQGASEFAGIDAAKKSRAIMAQTGDAYRAGAEKGREAFRAQKEAKKQKEQTQAAPQFAPAVPGTKPPASPTGNIPGVVPTLTGNTPAAPARPTSINITINSLVHSFTVNTQNVKDSATQIRAIVEDELTRVLNSVTVAYGR